MRLLHPSATANCTAAPGERVPEPRDAERSCSVPRPPAQRLRPATIAGVQFSADLRDRVADGTITVSYRLWSRPKVKVGGLYRSGSVMIEVDEIELLPFSSITDEDLARTGEPDLEALRRRAAHAGPVQNDTFLYRVQFHVAKAALD